MVKEKRQARAGGRTYEFLDIKPFELSRWVRIGVFPWPKNEHGDARYFDDDWMLTIMVVRDLYRAGVKTPAVKRLAAEVWAVAKDGIHRMPQHIIIRNEQLTLADSVQALAKNNGSYAVYISVDGISKKLDKFWENY